MNALILNGAFDRLHEGHKHLLRSAMSHPLLPMVMIAINSDASVAKLKGPDRPYQPVEERVDAVIDFCKSYGGIYPWIDVFNTEEELADLIRDTATTFSRENTYLIKGDDYRGKPITGEIFVREVIFIERLPGYSTTELNDAKNV